MSKLVRLTVDIDSQLLSRALKSPRITYITWDKGTLEELIETAYQRAATEVSTDTGCNLETARFAIICSIDKIFDNELTGAPDRTACVFDEMRRLREEMDATRVRLREVDAGASDAVYAERARLEECLTLLQQRYVRLCESSL